MDSIASLLNASRPAAALRKRWRIACVVILSCRAMRALPRRALVGVLRSPSFTAINMQSFHDEDGSSSEETPFSHVDMGRLMNLVKEKSLDDLRLLGGVRGLAAVLASDVDTGILGNHEDLQLRRETFGSNTYIQPIPKGFLLFILDAINDAFLLILAGCAVLSLAFGIKIHGIKDGWYDGMSIFLAIFLVVIVSAFSNFNQDRRFRKLSAESYVIEATVIRGGRRQDVSIFDVVVGDVVCLKIGDQVPADGLFLDGHSLRVDESSMTGESNHVEIDGDRNPFLTAGVKVVDGYARILITSVGMNTAWGEMMSSISRDTDERTPLQERLQKLTSSIGKIGVTIACIVLAVLSIRYFTGGTKDDNGQKEFNRRTATFDDVMNDMVNNISAAVTIIVVAIPEGLPLAVTLTLAYSMKRMMEDQAMVRKLSACETMGSTTTICTDKTGTLTLNQMKVVQFWVGEQQVVSGVGFVARSILELLHQGVAFNTAGSVYKPNLASEPEFTGSPTEKAILSWAVMELGLEFDELKQSCTILHVEAFNSERKRSGVVVRKEDEEKTTIQHWKGAAEMILARCSSYYESDGTVKAIDAEKRSKLEQIIEGMAACSLRCIAFACKQVIREDNKISEENNTHRLEENELTLLGLIGLKDPCRPRVRSAVKGCKLAGVDVKMITGDNIFTAKAIAFECGILTPDDANIDGAVVEGQEFRNYSMQERLEKVGRIRVMARSSPFDKLLMVQCLKQKGHVVAVTGDGTNDAPALKEADVGLAMGIQGTTVAKESSDIVILDDNFHSIVTVLRWGRSVYNNIQKFIQFQLTVNVVALVINCIAAISSGKVPLTTVQLLWVNLIMDTLGALALATERPTQELMKKPPIGRIEPLITWVMWRNLIAQALFQIIVLLVLQLKGRSIFGVNERVKNTLIFNTFVLCQIFNEVNARKLEKKNVFEGIHKNWLFLGIVAFTLILQVVMVEVLNRFASTTRLNWGQWNFCCGIAMLSWPIGWVAKCIPVSN
uniref:Calcium-transporting ATPase n=1 Tax=Elaeis guineensis var. tenera TaxID=51953 RepID=A0A6I9RHW3_ELAGV|nr:putative calcium-transporting ATPase 13, plasma membrane-type [Elaeis guineensis]